MVGASRAAWQAKMGGVGKASIGPSGAADPRIAKGVFAALVLACLLALLITQRLKHTPTPVEDFKRTNLVVPGSTGEDAQEHISFKLTKADRVTVTVENASGEPVATLLANLPVGRYKTLSLRWNGRRGVASGYGVIRKADGYTTLVPHTAGAVAPPGEYGVRVYLANQKRSIPLQRTFRLAAP